MTDSKERPGWGERIGYGFGTMGIALPLTVLGSYLTIYLTNVAFLDVAAVSLIMAVSKAFDGISDLVIGNIIDRTSSKLGKARVWLLRMALPLAVAVFLLFRVPSQCPDALKYVYVFIMYILVYTVILTFVQISHFAMVPLMSPDHVEQGLLGNIQSLAMNCGMLIGGILFVKLLEIFTDDPGNQNTQKGYSYAVLIFCVIMIVLVLIMVFMTRERVTDGRRRVKGARRRAAELVSDLRIIINEKNWVIIVICFLLCSLMRQFRIMGTAFYALYILGDMSNAAWLNGLEMGASMFIQLFTPFMMRRFGMKRMYSAGILLMTAGLAGLGLSTSSGIAIRLFMIVIGTGNGLYYAVSFGLVAAIITDIRERTGCLLAGTGNAGISLVRKLGQGFGSAIYGAILSGAGFNAALDTQGIGQTHAVYEAISAMYIWLPMAMLICVFVLFTFLFDREGSIGERHNS